MRNSGLFQKMRRQRVCHIAVICLAVLALMTLALALEAESVSGFIAELPVIGIFGVLGAAAVPQVFREHTGFI